MFWNSLNHKSTQYIIIQKRASFAEVLCHYNTTTYKSMLWYEIQNDCWYAFAGHCAIICIAIILAHCHKSCCKKRLMNMTSVNELIKVGLVNRIKIYILQNCINIKVVLGVVKGQKVDNVHSGGSETACHSQFDLKFSLPWHQHLCKKYLRDGVPLRITDAQYYYQSSSTTTLS